MRQINKAGIDLIKRFEGFMATAYKDAVNVWTIGYGHTNMAGHPEVRRGMTITVGEGEMILKKDLVTYERAVINSLGDHIDKLSDNQFAACVSLCYNVGPGNFRRSSVVKAIEEDNLNKAARKFLLWNKAGGRVLKGLVRRREAERKLFLRK